MPKKPYSKPTVTDHGRVVEKTKGRSGFAFEPIGELWDEEPPPIPPYPPTWPDYEGAASQ